MSPPLSASKMSPHGSDSPREFMSPSNAHAWSGIVDPNEREGILTGTNDANDSTVRYGDKIRLFSRSKYIEEESNLEGGYVGYYFRSRKGAKGEEGLILNGKETQLAVLSPAGPEKEILYHEGEEVQAGGAAAERSPGSMTMPSPRNTIRGRAGSVSPHPGSLSPTKFRGGAKGIRRVVNAGNPPVKFYSDSVELVVTKSLRMNKKIGNPISNFKRGTSRVLGGYLTCEKVGFPLDFKIHRAPPSILTATTFSYHDSMRMHSFHNINWGEEIELTVPLDVNLVATQPVLSVTLSNGQYAMFNQSEVLKQPGKAFWVDVMGAPMGEPSRLLCQFDCFSGNDKLSPLSLVKSNRRFFLVTWASAVAVILSALGGFFVRRNKFVYVNPAYDRGGILSESDQGVWSYYTSSITSNDSISPIEGVCGTGEACADEKYLWSTTSVVVSCIIGSITSLLSATGLIFYIFGNRVFMLQFIEKIGRGWGLGGRKKHLAPFVAVLLGWETGLAKDAGKTPMKKGKFSFPDKYGAIDPTTGLPPLPERFLIAEEHDKDKALERWRDTLRWRNEKKADDVLNVPHPKFDAIKKYYPSFYHCRDKEGNMVYIERPGGVVLSRIKKNGITVDKLIWHYMYCIEYLWQKFSPLETDRLTTILDLKGVSILMVVGDVRNFIKGCISMTSTHYPARGHKLFIINSPGWLNRIWGWIKPMLNAQMEEKLKILTSGEKQAAELLKVIDGDNLPELFGGRNKTVIGESKYDKELRDWVVGVLEKEGMEMDTWV
ncbi:hypothetical protein TrRE_jg10285 [Triparma retinervis]|uniref:CRAL-TRIO domain-containing protein n=1 Tax=Triparma retinervis TaxID=2557542 RepID=A0A9W7CEW3_9STRA|nr:hypothetical protein TrRE_jg10285 [Triparma retinervis]